MLADLRKNAEPRLNEGALLKACLVGGVVVILFWLATAVVDPAADLSWTVAGSVIAAVLAAFLSARRCGLRRRADGVAHGVLAWAMTTALTSLVLLPTVSAIGLSGPGNGRYERFKILAAELVAGPGSVAEREQVERFLQRFELKTDASLMLALERAAIDSDENSIRAALQKHAALAPEQLDSIVSHTLILYRDSQTTAAERAILHDNIMGATRVAWSLLLVLSISLLLSMWAGARGVRATRANVRVAERPDAA